MGEEVAKLKVNEKYMGYLSIFRIVERSQIVLREGKTGAASSGD
jgi:hypothetical protein